MVVCKFFQQGNCRYGQNCRFDHIYGSKYSYHAPSQQTSQPTQATVTDEQQVNQVLSHIQATLKGGQWILSCYSPFKNKPNFPGITDLSMEEARLFIYEAKANNNLDQAVAYMNNLFKEATYKYEQILQGTPAIMKVLWSLYKGEVVQSPFTNTSGGFGGGSTASSIFRSAAQSPVFGQTTSNNNPSVFNQSPGFGENKSVFGQTNQGNPKSIFSQANQSVFGPSQAFPNVQTCPDSAKSIFAQANQNEFSQPSNPKSIFGQASQSAFGYSNDAFNQNKDPFSQNKDPFNQNKDPFSQNRDPFTQNKDPFTQNKDPFSQNKDLFTQNKDPFSQNKDPFTQNKDPFNQNKDPFSQPKDPFQQNPFASSPAYQSQENCTNIYSDINELKPEQIEAFQASDFKLGLIPEVPPPYSLCF